MTKLFQIFLAGFLLLAAAAHACNSSQPIVAPCAPKVASESRGDELDAKGGGFKFEVQQPRAFCRQGLASIFPCEFPVCRSSPDF